MALGQAGATLSEMIRIQVLASISLTLPRMWLWALSSVCVCVFVCILCTSMLVCYFWGPHLSNQQEMENYCLWFATQKTHAEVREFGDAALLPAEGLTVRTAAVLDIHITLHQRLTRVRNNQFSAM